eukprot:PhF_6_TR35024/c1_g1_i1/m.51012
MVVVFTYFKAQCMSKIWSYNAVVVLEVKEEVVSTSGSTPPYMLWVVLQRYPTVMLHQEEDVSSKKTTETSTFRLSCMYHRVELNEEGVTTCPCHPLSCLPIS